MDSAPVLFLGNSPIAMIIMFVYLILLFHSIAVSFSSICVFISLCVVSVALLPLCSCLGCTPPLIGLPFLRSLLRSVLCGCL